MGNLFLQKRGQIGDYVFMVYRLLLITLVAVVVLSICATSYSLDINVRDAEARVLGHNVLLCLIEHDVLRQPQFVLDDMQYTLLEYCGISGDLSRVYVSVMYESDGKEIVLEQGDSGGLFINELVAANGPEFAQYRPGFYSRVFFIDGEEVNVRVNFNADS